LEVTSNQARSDRNGTTRMNCSICAAVYTDGYLGPQGSLVGSNDAELLSRLHGGIKDNFAFFLRNNNQCRFSSVVLQSHHIDPLFSTTEITDPDGNAQYPYFWTGTNHQDGVNHYDGAVYIAFGEAQGMMNNMLLDVHGAGAQRSDPKGGDPDDYPQYFGPQGDLCYVFNYVRCVRTIE
ncbi:hypothetical protein H206_02652, partial [Candidatus Electrothrix aarhusensis]